MENKNNNNKLLQLIILVSTVTLALYVGIRLGKVTTSQTLNFFGPQPSKVSVMLDYISKYYVDDVSVDSISELLIPDILKELDPHSVYIPAARLQQSNEQLEGNFDGIGVTFNMDNDTVRVINVVPGGPSEKAGVYSSDKIITVNDSIIAGRKISQDSILSLFRGKSGSIVKILVKRDGFTELLPFEITRGKIQVKSVDAFYMISPTVGYIRMTTFAKTTYSEFIDAVNKLHELGMTSLIFDLRGNTGGLLDQAIAITSELFAEKKLIVYTKGKGWARRNQYSEGKGKLGNDTLVVLINENSASASEVLAGAVQDNDRGVIIGHRSFGKGLVQQLFPLPDNSELRLTIARYYTPSGRSIQRAYSHGDGALDNYYNEFYQRGERGEYTFSDSIKHSDTTKYYTSNKKIVYGGGGITPDVFVANEKYGDFVLKVRGNFNQWANAFGDKNRRALNEIQTIEQLNQFFEKNDPYAGFIEHVKSEGIQGTQEEIDNSMKQLQLIIKSRIGISTFLGYTGEVYFLNQMDSTIIKAIEILKDKDVLEKILNPAQTEPQEIKDSL